MTVGLATGSILASQGQAISLSSLFTVTPGSGNPQYLIVSGLDRNEYTAAATGSTGTFSGNGATTGFTSIGSDGYGAGIVFTYNAATGQYVNPSFGNLTSVVLTASQDTTRNESISVFATNSATNIAQYANNPYALSQFTTYVGSVSVVTQPALAGTQPSQATPASIANTAMSFVGQAWNTDGCWVLASNIAAEAGASLPLSSTSLGVPGTANGEWIVAYSGPGGSSGDWQSMVKAGDMVSFQTSANSGHITTVVSGVGASAMLVDNIAYVNSNGTYANAANDGSANDIKISAPHAASQEFSQAVAGSVVIYRLDTPTVTATSSATVAAGGKVGLSGLFTASDPANHAVTQYQVYDSASDSFIIDGAAQAAHSAASALTVSATSLANASYVGDTAGTDTLTVRAFNGSYWGDWQSMSVNVSTPAASTPTPPALAAPVVSAHTANQVFMSKRAVSFTLAANTFTDPQGLGMTYAAYQVGGTSAPWLKFNAATQTFSGTPKKNASGTVTVEVVATDSAGLNTAETFTITMAPTAAKFAQAISAVHSQAGGVAVANTTPPANHLHALSSPVA